MNVYLAYLYTTSRRERLPSNQKKRDSFRRLATKRTNIVLDKLRILGHCANRRQYEYEPEEVKRIFRAIETELRAVRAKFQDTDQSKFTL